MSERDAFTAMECGFTVSIDLVAVGFRYYDARYVGAGSYRIVELLEHGFARLRLDSWAHLTIDVPLSALEVAP
jgi:hypothetical protein